MTQKAAGYIRVSTSAQIGEDKVSLGEQTRKIKDYCHAYNLELLPIYNEGGQSGADADRPVFKQLMADAHQHKFDTVVVWALDRFGRETVDVLFNARALKRLGIELVFLKEQIQPGPYGDVMRTMLASFGELERKVIKERTHGARNKLWREKKRWIGQVPFGYVFDATTCRMVQLPEEAKVVRQIVDLYLNNVNYSFADICIILNDELKTTKRGKKWNTANLSSTLSKTIYYGYVVTNTHIMNTKGKRIGDKHPDEHIVWTVDDIDPIMTKKEWDAIHAKAANGRLRVGRPFEYSTSFLLHRLLRCGMCGNIITPYRYRGKRFYKCRWRKAGAKEREIRGVEKCTLPTIPAELIENWIWDCLMETFGREKETHLGGLIQNDIFDEQIADQESKIVNIKKTIAQKERSVKRLDEQILMGEDDDYNPTEFRFKRRELSNDITHLKNDFSAAQARLKKLQDNKADQVKFQELLGNEALLSSIWLAMDELPFAGRQRLLQGLLDGPVTIYPPRWLSEEQIKKLTAGSKHLVDAGKSKPKFHYNDAVLEEVLGVNKYLGKL